mmetsp:Transcript_41389/g.124989  ORF Transcript_41389/g.124989 Transcript_41389/m.124989 type:complete len:289 (-) Transcript_41389:338-1204(-)
MAGTSTASGPACGRAGRRLACSPIDTPPNTRFSRSTSSPAPRSSGTPRNSASASQRTPRAARRRGCRWHWSRPARPARSPTTPASPSSWPRSLRLPRRRGSSASGSPMAGTTTATCGPPGPCGPRPGRSCAGKKKGTGPSGSTASQAPGSTACTCNRRKMSRSTPARLDRRPRARPRPSWGRRPNHDQAFARDVPARPPWASPARCPPGASAAHAAPTRSAWSRSGGLWCEARASGRSTGPACCSRTPTGTPTTTRLSRSTACRGRGNIGLSSNAPGVSPRIATARAL